MDLSLIIIILLVVFIGLKFIFSDSSGQNPNTSSEEPSSGNPNVEISSPQTASGNSGSTGSSSSLLNQLSMINSRSFPALSTKQLPDKLEAFFGRKDILNEVNSKNWGGSGPIVLYGKKGIG
ncbi:MAG: hypothetical protein VW455_05480 [Nitrospinota bacterium]